MEETKKKLSKLQREVGGGGLLVSGVVGLLVAAHVARRSCQGEPLSGDRGANLKHNATNKSPKISPSTKSDDQTTRTTEKKPSCTTISLPVDDSNLDTSLDLSGSKTTRDPLENLGPEASEPSESAAGLVKKDQPVIPAVEEINTTQEKYIHEKDLVQDREDTSDVVLPPKVRPTSTLEDLAAQFQALCGEPQPIASERPLNQEDLEARYQSLLERVGTLESFSFHTAKEGSPTSGVRSIVSNDETVLDIEPTSPALLTPSSEKDVDQPSSVGSNETKVLEPWPFATTESFDASPSSDKTDEKKFSKFLVASDSQESSGRSVEMALGEIVSSMKQNPEKLEIQVAGCQQLFIATSSTELSAILSSGLAEAVIQAMEMHQEEVDVQKQGCSALNALACVCSKAEAVHELDALKELGAKKAIDAAIGVLKKSKQQ